MPTQQSVVVFGQVTNAVTGERSTGRFAIVINRTVEGCPIVRLLHGPCGSASFALDGEVDLSNLTARGWVACAGVPNQWDSLAIPGSEMEWAIEALGLETLQQQIREVKAMNEVIAYTKPSRVAKRREVARM